MKRLKIVRDTKSLTTTPKTLHSVRWDKSRLLYCRISIHLGSTLLTLISLMQPTEALNVHRSCVSFQILEGSNYG